MGKYRKALRFAPLPEVRTQIVERARYRIPNVMLCPLPIPDAKVVTSVPWVIIEILSPDGRLPDQPSGSLPFDTAALFQQLGEERNEGRP